MTDLVRTPGRGYSAQAHVVWREGSNRPTKLHLSFHRARKEAERLAKLYPDAKFHVLSTTQVIAHA